MNDKIMFIYYIKNIRIVSCNLRENAGFERLIFQVPVVNFLQLHEIGKMKWPVDDIYIIFLDIEGFHQELQQVIRHVGAYLEPDSRCAPFSMLDLLGYFSKQILGFVLCNFDVGISRYSECI